MEVLSPAGSKDSLVAAIKGGADAVYLGGKLFGARRTAQNFSDGELKCAIKLAHDSSVKVYVTVNTLIKEAELSTAFSYLDYLNSINADAVIVQDRGLIHLIRDNFDLPIHASTQLGVHSPEDAQWAKANGIERAILSRELRMDELRRIREASSIGLEVFIHGALCYCFSGQCLFSSLLGGRSGNRGLCAQPCRKRYSMGKESAFFLSTADLFSINLIPELMSAGVDAIKIEGRLRSPTYVYLASRAYRQAIDRAKAGEDILITPREREMLAVAFNRGFSGGYLSTDDVMQRKYAESRGLPLGIAVSHGRTVTVPGDKLRPGDGITFYRGEEKIGGFEVKTSRQDGGATVLEAPFRLELGEYDAYKTKDREFPSIERLLASPPFTGCHAERKNKPLVMPRVQRRPTRGELSFYVSDIPALVAVLPYAQRVYFEGMNDHIEAARLCDEAGKELVLMMPRVTPIIPDTEANSIMVNSPGQAYKFADRRVYGSYFLNLFNSLTLPELYQYTVSVELSREDISELAAYYLNRLEMLVFGRIELMVTRDPSLPTGTLVDERGKRFPVRRDEQGYAHILNSADLFLLDFINELDGMGINSYGIDLRGRPKELCAMVAKAFGERDMRMKDRIKRKCHAITAGHYLRGVQ